MESNEGKTPPSSSKAFNSEGEGCPSAVKNETNESEKINSESVSLGAKKRQSPATEPESTTTSRAPKHTKLSSSPTERTSMKEPLLPPDVDKGLKSLESVLVEVDPELSRQVALSDTLPAGVALSRVEVIDRATNAIRRLHHENQQLKLLMQQLSLAAPHYRMDVPPSDEQEPPKQDQVASSQVLQQSESVPSISAAQEMLRTHALQLLQQHQQNAAANPSASSVKLDATNSGSIRALLQENFLQAQQAGSSQAPTSGGDDTRLAPWKPTRTSKPSHRGGGSEGNGNEDSEHPEKNLPSSASRPKPASG